MKKNKIKKVARKNGSHPFLRYEWVTLFQLSFHHCDHSGTSKNLALYGGPEAFASYKKKSRETKRKTLKKGAFESKQQFDNMNGISVVCRIETKVAEFNSFFLWPCFV
jgi:hypothetical protein